MKRIFNIGAAVIALAALLASLTGCSNDFAYPPVSAPGQENYVGNGTKADPYNVPLAMRLIASGQSPIYACYVTGTVVEIESFSADYGNFTYLIADPEFPDYQITVYQGLGLGAQKFTSDDELKVGDVVTVCGQFIYYNNTTPEIQSGNFLYALNGEVMPGAGEAAAEKAGMAPAQGNGTWETPFNVGSVLEAAAKGKLPAGSVYIEGVVALVTDYNSTYGNYTFYLQDEGYSAMLYIYRCVGEGGAKLSADALKAGDKVIIYGSLMLYKGNPQVGQGGQAMSINGSQPANPPVGGETIFSETFASGQGDFLIDNVEMNDPLTYIWSHDASYKCMKASSFINSANHQCESWLISPEIDLAGAEAASLAYAEAGNKFSPATDFATFCTVNVREGADGAWQELAVEGRSEGASWTFVNASASLDAFAGKKIQIGFKYTSTDANGGTWEVKDVAVTKH